MVYHLIRPLLFHLDAERAHRMSLVSLNVAHSLGLTKLLAPHCNATPKRVMGLDFPNPVGLAAGLDKNGAYLNALAELGFGFLEIGTVTPRPQPGNPKPRLFRIPQARAIVNRFGFNNLGVDNLVKNVSSSHYNGILGINIGKNFDTPIERAAEDYLTCLRKVYAHADYVAINISSPNTSNLRLLQEKNALHSLLAALKQEQARLADEHGNYVPIALKIAPDLDPAQIVEIADLLLEHSMDAVIATNSTVSRDGVQDLPNSEEKGGLSGAPLRTMSTNVIRQLSLALGKEVPIIGVGGIMSGADAEEKILAGASLVQIYSGMVFQGPGLVSEVCKTLGACRT